MIPHVVTIAGSAMLVLLGLGLAAALAAELKARRDCGAVVRRVPGSRLWRAAALPAVLAALAVYVAAGEGSPVYLAAGLAAALLVALTPPEDHQVCGEEGVRRGATSRRLEELEEWRLTGDHLRFRLHGLWTSVELPAAHHAAARARLSALCPERESGFKE